MAKRYITPPTVSETTKINASDWNQSVVDNQIVSAPDVFTKKGDLFIATGVKAGIALPVGSVGQILTPDQSQPAGVKWYDNNPFFVAKLLPAPDDSIAYLPKYGWDYSYTFTSSVDNLEEYRTITINSDFTKTTGFFDATSINPSAVLVHISVLGNSIDSNVKILKRKCAGVDENGVGYFQQLFISKYGFDDVRVLPVEGGVIDVLMCTNAINKTAILNIQIMGYWE